MNKTKLLISLVIASALLFSVPIFATGFEACDYGSSSAVCDGVGGNGSELVGVAMNVINTMLFVVGIAAVVVIILSGIYFVTSAGNSEGVKKAKSALTYSVVGLVVSILSYAIVNFVVSNI